MTFTACGGQDVQFCVPFPINKLVEIFNIVADQINKMYACDVAHGHLVQLPTQFHTLSSFHHVQS